MIYKTPEDHFFRLHHIRPRFKNNCEEVLLFMAGAIFEIGEGDSEIFKELFREKIYQFPGNATLSLKTVDNWRTEISSLFALFFEIEDWSYPSDLAIDLANSQDLSKFFKYFVHTFQYPGGHLKAETIIEIRDNKISFHPASFIIQLLENIEAKYGPAHAFINKAELTHCAYNDLRVTAATDIATAIQWVTELIYTNRVNLVEYDWDGDITRYAGDILDYMSLANLVTDYGGKFRLRKSEKRALEKIKKRKADYSYSNSATARSINDARADWFMYCNSFVAAKIFETDVLAFIAKDEAEYAELEKRTRLLMETEEPTPGVSTKRIGDYGESLVYGHECMSLRLKDKIDLIHLVKCIPNQFAVGYDIQSIDENHIKKYIEVKTSISSKRLAIDRFSLTPNEISSAQTLKENYYIYRLVINHEVQNAITMTVIQDPIGHYRKENLEINFRTGEVVFKKNVGQKVELLSWKD